MTQSTVQTENAYTYYKLQYSDTNEDKVVQKLTPEEFGRIPYKSIVELFEVVEAGEVIERLRNLERILVTENAVFVGIPDPCYPSVNDVYAKVQNAETNTDSQEEILRNMISLCSTND